MRTTQTPKRQMPVRQAKVRVNNPVTPTHRRIGGRVTRSSHPGPLPSTPSPSGSGSKRHRSPSPTPQPSNKRIRRPGRSSKSIVNYAESSDEDTDLSEFDVEAEDDEPLALQALGTKSDDEPLLSPIGATRPNKTRSRLDTKTAVTKTEKGGGSASLTKQTPTGASRMAKVQQSVTGQSQETSEPPVILPWAGLPYHVLLRIFEFAAGIPLTSGAGKWLLDTSTVCKAFAEPALTALYRQPPFLTLQMAHGLSDLLSKPPTETTFNYRQKINCFDIEAGTIASKTFRGRHLDFKALFSNAPRLTEVYIWHEKDQAPYREINKNIRWSYPADMYFALGIGLQNQAGARPGDFTLYPVEGTGSIPRLQAWMWSSRMLGDFPLEKLEQVHKFEAFRELRKLEFMNFQVPSLQSKDPETPEMVQADGEYVASLTRSISVLPDLRHLVLECSTAVTGQFLLSLPETVEHLELINCWEIKADHMANYLLTHGNCLRHLTLNHNQSLSLAFLPVLGRACPRLETLRMNLTYFKIHMFLNDSDPDFDTLLTADQVPTWPASLRSLDLKNLRKWDKDAAEVFFQSLLDSAPDLANLRHLEIKAMLDIPFRERSRLRDKWEAQLKQVFLRPWVDPQPNFTMRPKAQALNAPAQPSKVTISKKKLGRSAKQGIDSPPRRSGRIANIPSGPSSRASSIGRETRGRTGFYTEPNTDDELEDNESSSGADDQSPTAAKEDGAENSLFIQGLCNVVDVRFDNQKPVENQFRMEDFLDDGSNDPTDDDWDEDNESEDGYAW